MQWWLLRSFHAMTGARQFEEMLVHASTAQCSGDIFCTRVDLIECDSHGTDSESTRNTELGKDHSRPTIGHGKSDIVTKPRFEFPVAEWEGEKESAG